MKILKRFLVTVMAALLAAAPVSAATNGTIQLVPNVTEAATTDLGSTSWTYAGSGSAAATNWSKTFTNGTGLDQANKVFQDSVTLAGSGTQTYDLDSTLTGPTGNVTFSRIYAIIIKRSDTPAATTQDENVKVGGDFIVTKLLSDVGAATPAIPIRPGGIYYQISPDATGIAVTATTGDELTLTNASSADSCTLQVLIIGS